MAYYPNLVPPLRATRTSSLDGKTAGGGPTNQGDHLENWEGYRVFKDGRSQTGWSDTSGHVVGGIDTHGYPLLYNKDTKQLDYNVHHHGGISLASLGSIGKYATGLLSGFEKMGLGALTPGGVGILKSGTGAIPTFQANQEAGLGILNTIGEIGGTALAGGIIAGGGAALPGQGGGGMDLSGILSTDDSGGLPDWLQTIEEGVGIYQQISGPQGGAQHPAPPPPTASSMAGTLKWVGIGAVVLVVVALALGVRRR